MLIETPGEITSFVTVPPDASGTPGPSILIEAMCCEGSGIAPAVPAAPPAAGFTCTPATITVGSPAWPDDMDAPDAPDTVEIYRDDLPIGAGPLAIFESALDFYVDPDVSSPNSYTYFARACNDAGCSIFSPPRVVSLAADLTIELLSPTAGDTISDVTRIVVRVTSAAGLTMPVSLKLFGQPLPVVAGAVNGNASEHYTDLDTTTFDYQGEIEITVQATNGAGCKSLLVSFRFDVMNTLQTATKWHEIKTDAPADLRAAAVIVYAGLDQSGGPQWQKWHEFAVATPPPVGWDWGYWDTLTDLQKEQAWLASQPIVINEEQTLLGTSRAGEANARPTGRVLFRKRSRPKEFLARYPLAASKVLSMRPVNDGEIEIVTGDPALIYRFTKTGLELKYTLADYGAGDAIAAVWQGDKIIAARPAQIKIIDTDQGEGTFSGTIDNPLNMPPLAVERLGNDTAIFFGLSLAGAPGAPVGNFAAYRHAGDQLKTLYALGERLAFTKQRQETIVAATTGIGPVHRLHESRGGAALVQLVEVADAITAVLLSGTVQTGFAYQFASDRRIFQAVQSAGGVATGAAVPIAGPFDFDILDLEQWQGAADVPRRALAGDSNTLWLEDPTGPGAYIPRLVLEATATIKHLSRLIYAIIEPSGDPLQGGTPGVFDDSLLMAVERPGELAYLARLQEAPHTPGYSYSAARVHPYGPTISDYTSEV